MEVLKTTRVEVAMVRLLKHLEYYHAEVGTWL